MAALSVELRHLRVFFATVRDVEFGDVAGPLLARREMREAVETLEPLLGHALVVRIGDDGEVTPAGLALYHRLQTLLPQIDRAVRAS